MAKILIVEDEKNIRELLKKNLSTVGHICTTTGDGRDAKSILSDDPGFDLLIFDVMLPGNDGFELLDFAKTTITPPPPVIFVTAKTSLDDRLRGLRYGADDYIMKPFEILELIARVDVVLRRYGKSANVEQFDDISIDFVSRKVLRGGVEVPLKPKEYALLEVLVRNRNFALSRDKLLSLVWGYDYEGDERTVDVHIQQLRMKLGLHNRIKTVYKIGYRFEM